MRTDEQAQRSLGAHTKLRLSDGWSVSFDVNVVTFIMSVRLRKQDETWLSPVHHLSRYTECGCSCGCDSPHLHWVSVVVSVPVPFPVVVPGLCLALLQMTYVGLAFCLGPNSLGVCIRWRVVSAVAHPICIIRLQAATATTAAEATAVICQSVSI